jgi:ribosome biogenesis GTPase
LTRQEKRYQKRKLSTEPKHVPAPERNGNEATGLVVGIETGICTVSSNGTVSQCKSIAGIAIGDRVDFNEHGIREVLPRRTVLSRPDPQNPRIERVLAANIDIVVHVAAIVTPPLRPGLIDRYLVAIARGGAEAILCINKIDLLRDAKELEPINTYRSMGVAVFLCSAETREGIAELQSALQGKTCVFTGHSGVGKSSLLNAILPSLDLRTSGVSGGSGKGLHTTTSSALYELPNGTRVIDTPGVRQFGMWKLSPEELRLYFQEFEAFRNSCRFSDCTHTHEPECGVRTAAEYGDIAPERYRAYQRILSTLED